MQCPGLVVFWRIRKLKMEKQKLLILVSLVIVLSACGGGGGGSGGGSSTPTVYPDPNQTPGTYNGVPYSQLGYPPGLTDYPNVYFPTFATTSTNRYVPQIAYGYNTNQQIINLTGEVTASTSVDYNDGLTFFCSATPVKYDPESDWTFLVTAAHCVVNGKQNLQTVLPTDLFPYTNVYYGMGLGTSTQPTVLNAIAVYVMNNYCYDDSFPKGETCSNFNTDDQASSSGQSNDLAIIQVQGQFGDPESYPQIAPASAYPAQLSMAPVLSIGYGYNTQSPQPDSSLTGNQMYYVANYYYLQDNSTGYHYLQNSYFNSSQNGYASLICSGDSGSGDIFWTGQNWILMSVHSYGFGNSCGAYFPSPSNYATNVSAYYDWVMGILNSSTPIADCKNGIISNCVTNGN
jgi:hypothetical protein